VRLSREGNEDTQVIVVSHYGHTWLSVEEAQAGMELLLDKAGIGWFKITPEPVMGGAFGAQVIMLADDHQKLWDVA